MNYFRAILEKDERSSRALEVVTRTIKYNSGCYTAWYFRRLLLESLKSDLKIELQYCTEMAKDHQKNYQVWFHRKWLVEKLQDPNGELEFTAHILHEDAKNYHAWSHRQWCIKTFKLWDNELEYVEGLIALDVRNNSAWNQRYFVIYHLFPGLPKDVIQKEIAYAISKISTSPNNECGWNYMIGMCKGHKLTDFEAILSFAFEKESKWPHCANLLSLLIDIADENMDYEKAIAFCNRLVNGVDDIHKKYWAYRLTTYQSKLQ